MPGACFTTILLFTWAISLVVDHQELLLGPVGRVVADMSSTEVLLVGINVGPEDAILVIDHQIHFILQSISPLIAPVTPWAVILFFAPWVANLDKFHPITELLSLKHGECVTHHKPDCVRFLIVTTVCVCLNVVTLRVVVKQQVPQCCCIISLYLCVVNIYGRASCEGRKSISGIAFDQVLVVAVSLGKDFLKNGHPK